MKIQKPGRLVGLARTLWRILASVHPISCTTVQYGKTYPQKMSVNVNAKLAMLPPDSAVSIPAMARCVNVLVNKRKAQIKRNINAPRSCTACVGSALRYRPIG